MSVRSQKTGKGSAIRVFVDLAKMLCFSQHCANKYSTVPVQDRNSAWCEHLKEGLQATETARQIQVQVSCLNDLNLDTETLDLVTSQSENGSITIYEINRTTIVTPSFGSFSASGVIGLTHVKELDCKLKDCKSVKTAHTLAKKTNKICLHNLLVLKSGLMQEKPDASEVKTQIDHFKTVTILLQKIENNFPSMNDKALKDFLPKNKVFVDKLRYNRYKF